MLQAGTVTKRIAVVRPICTFNSYGTFRESVKGVKRTKPKYALRLNGRGTTTITPPLVRVVATSSMM